MTHKRGHRGLSGAKIRYPSEDAAQAAVDARLAEGVNSHTGERWRTLAVYQCKECKGWHFTSQATYRNPNFAGGGWARSYLLADIELGRRATAHYMAENRGIRTKGKDSVMDRLRSAERKRRQRMAA